jgi:hypothetical protein
MQHFKLENLWFSFFDVTNRLKGCWSVAKNSTFVEKKGVHKFKKKLEGKCGIDFVAYFCSTMSFFLSIKSILF